MFSTFINSMALWYSFLLKEAYEERGETQPRKVKTWQSMDNAASLIHPLSFFLPTAVSHASAFIFLILTPISVTHFIEHLLGWSQKDRRITIISTFHVSMRYATAILRHHRHATLRSTGITLLLLYNFNFIHFLCGFSYWVLRSWQSSSIGSFCFTVEC